MTELTKTELPAHIKVELDRWLLRYPADQRRSGVLEALRMVQTHNNGFLTEDLMDAVADYLDMPRVAVYEVATFYSMYNLKPVGRHVLNVCNNLPCVLRDSEKIIEHLCKRLEVGIDETTPDGKFTLREVECLGACINAPVLHLGNQYHEKLTPEKIDALLDELE